MKPKGFKFPNIYEEGRKLYTISLTKKKTFPDEITISKGGKFYREWDPTRSKLAAALAKGLSQIGFKTDSTVLYLGAAHGYTPSFVSDIVTEGMIFGVDLSPQVMRDLIFVAHDRPNLTPILLDAAKIEELGKRITKVDMLFQDIAQRNQTQIFLDNFKFVKPGGFGMLAVKARSVDVSKKPKTIFKQVRAELEQHLTIVDYRELDPFEKDHCFFMCKKK